MRNYQEQYNFFKSSGMEHDAIEAQLETMGLRRKRTVNSYKNFGNTQKEVKQKKQEDTQEEGGKKMDYINYMNNNKNSDIIWVRGHLEMLMMFINTVREEKGIIQILSIGEWGRVVEKLKAEYNQFNYYSATELFDIYLKHLIEYEYYLNGKELRIKKGVDISKSISEGHFVKGQLKQIMNNSSKGVEMYDYEVVVFSNGVDELGISYDEINLTKIEKECGNQQIELRIQNPSDFSFIPKKNTNISHRMTIKEYCDYQKNVNDKEYLQKNFGDTLKGGKIFFGVNFQPSKLYIFNQLWKHLEGNFLGYRQSFDLLSYLDQDIPGCSSPQFYLKVKGCWTGGHQQNISMCAVNINHGPDASQWYTVPYEHVERVRAALNEKFKCDLYRDEGLWFQRMNWFIQNGYPIKRILQRKGDIVISGPGTLHWVRSFGVALQSAWNVFPVKYHMIQAALHRHFQNESTHHERAGTIPLKSLLLKLLDHNLNQIDEKSIQLILVHIEIWKSREERLRLALNDKQNFNFNFQLENAVLSSLRDLESICLICKQEVFNYYVFDWDGDGIVCLGCLLKNVNDVKGKEIRLHLKYSIKQLKNLIERAQNRDQYQNMTFETKICSGTHIGRITCNGSSQKTGKRTRESFQKCNQRSNFQFLQNKNEKSKMSQENLNLSQSKIKQVKVIHQQTQTNDMNCPCCEHGLNYDKMQPKKCYKYNEHHSNDHHQNNGRRHRDQSQLNVHSQRESRYDQRQYSRREGSNRDRNNNEINHKYNQRKSYGNNDRGGSQRRQADKEEYKQDSRRHEGGRNNNKQYGSQTKKNETYQY